MKWNSALTSHVTALWYSSQPSTYQQNSPVPPRYTIVQWSYRAPSCPSIWCGPRPFVRTDPWVFPVVCWAGLWMVRLWPAIAHWEDQVSNQCVAQGWRLYVENCTVTCEWLGIDRSKTTISLSWCTIRSYYLPFSVRHRFAVWLARQFLLVFGQSRCSWASVWLPV